MNFEVASSETFPVQDDDRAVHNEHQAKGRCKGDRPVHRRAHNDAAKKKR